MTSAIRHTDVAIIGAGILGLSHAYAFAKRGLRVTVFERQRTPLGASIRNFGMVLVTGQPPGTMHALARASRQIWLSWASAVGPRQAAVNAPGTPGTHKGIHLRQSGSLLMARTPTEAALLRAFVEARALSRVADDTIVPMADDAGYAVTLLDAHALQSLYDGRFRHHHAALHGHEDLQVYSREAIPALAAHLASAFGVSFQFGTLAREIDAGRVDTTAGVWQADHIVVCSGHDYQTLLADELAALKPRVCRLQMLRVAMDKPFALDHAILTGLSCLHYGAFSDLPEAAALQAEVAAREPALLAHGIHLLASPTPDGELIIGDSHDYGDDASPFNTEEVDDWLTGLVEQTFGMPVHVRERWQGVYGASNRTTGAPFSIVHSERGATGVVMHSGVGMSIGPALAERVTAHLLDGTALPQ